MADESLRIVCDMWVKITQQMSITFREWFNMMAPMFIGGQGNTVNITNRSSANPDIERVVVQNIASYGRQLGRMSDALEFALDRLKMTADNPDLGPRERKAVEQFRTMADQIRDFKDAVEAEQRGTSVAALRAAEQAKPAGNGSHGGKRSRGGRMAALNRT